MRKKLIELIIKGSPCPEPFDPWGRVCHSCRYGKSKNCPSERLADYLIANGVTFATDNNFGHKGEVDFDYSAEDE